MREGVGSLDRFEVLLESLNEILGFGGEGGEGLDAAYFDVLVDGLLVLQDGELDNAEAAFGVPPVEAVG